MDSKELEQDQKEISNLISELPSDRQGQRPSFMKIFLSRIVVPSLFYYFAKLVL